MVFSTGALFTVLPSPPDVDAVGWKYGCLGDMQGWFPPAFIEDSEPESIRPADSASNLGDVDTSLTDDDSASSSGFVG